MLKYKDNIGVNPVKFKEVSMKKLLVALLAVAMVVALAACGSKKEAKKLKFSEKQAQAILDLRLAKLIGLEILQLKDEYDSR